MSIRQLWSLAGALVFISAPVCPLICYFSACLPVYLSVWVLALDTILHLILSDPALVWWEVARAKYTNSWQPRMNY